MVISKNAVSMNRYLNPKIGNVMQDKSIYQKGMGGLSPHVISE